MTPNGETLKIITAWLTSLADVTSHSADGRPSKTALATYATLLGQDFPSGAFTAESLRYVVGTEAWWPPVATITAKVAEWWRDNRPVSVAVLQHESAVGLAGMDLHWLNFWYRRLPEINALDDRRVVDAQRANLASLVRAVSPKAWAAISGTPETQHSAPNFAAIQAVRATVASLQSDDARPGDVRRRQPRDVSLKGQTLDAARANLGRAVMA